MTQQKERKIYLNEKQAEFIKATQPVKLFLAGRRTGKTRAIGHERYRSAARFPKATGGLVGQTYGALLNVTLPELQATWEECYGMKEGLHYVIGQRPPNLGKPGGFAKAYKEPRKYQNVVSWFNGHRIQLMSSDRPDLHRGGTLIDLDADEGLRITADAMYKVFFPMVSSYLDKFDRKAPGFHQKRIYSSVPWLERGFYLMDIAKKAKQSPQVFHCTEACTMDNVAVLGLDYIRMLKETLPPQVYLAEVLNQFIRSAPDGYYHHFKQSRHCVSEVYSYGEGERGITVERDDRDRDPHSLIDFSCDFGGRINCGIAIQSRGRSINILRDFYVLDDEGKLRELVDKFCDAYESHQYKYVRLWGEPKGKAKQVDGAPYFEAMRAFFQERGWGCEVCADIKYEDHLSRHNLIAEILSEKNPDLPIIRINEVHCQALILVLETTKIRDDFTKDKSNEKKPDFPQEQAPHLSDAFDYYIVQCFPHLLNSDGSFHLVGNEVDFL